MRRWTIAAALLAAACGGNDTPGDGTFDWIEMPDFEEVPVDVPPDTGTDPVVDGQGQFRVHLPSEVAPGDGLAMRISHPAEDEARFDEGAPVVVMAPGGLSVGTLGYDEVHPVTAAAGVVTVLALLQGGGDEYAHVSSGDYDYRGPDSKRAMRDIIRYAHGELPDDDGFLITDRIPWADTGHVGVVGLSHGGNLALTTFADHASAVGGVDWFASWESPVGDQYVGAELGSVGSTLNPFYAAGSSTLTQCPWPGFQEALAWDADYSINIVDPLDGTSWGLRGIFYVDADGNSVRGVSELMIPGVPGPGITESGEHMPYLYYSTEMADAIDARAGVLFPAGLPAFLATTAAMREYWAERDGSLVVGDVHGAFPGLLVMVLGTVEDHVQGQPDHPHLRSHLAGWLDAGHAWARLNPDAAYMAEASGTPAAGIPELAAGDPLPWPDTGDHLIPETLEPHVITAAVMELADRTRAGNTDADLDAIIY